MYEECIIDGSGKLIPAISALSGEAWAIREAKWLLSKVTLSK